MRYQLLFQIQAEHGYYPDNRCTGLSWTPSPGTETTMARYRLQWRPLPNGGAVWQPLADDNQALIPLASGDVFRFQLSPLENNWHQFTVGPTPGSHWVFSNREATAPTTALAAREEPGSDTWGEAEIVVNASVAVGKIFTCQLSPQAVAWRYYLIHDGQTYGDPNKFTIEDGSQETPALSFPAAQRRSLTQNPDPADPVAVTLAGQLAGKNLMRLSTGAPVAARQKARRNIRLKYGNSVLINHLPNPAPADRGVKIVYVP